MELETLKKQRKNMLLLNLFYFIGLLLIGISLFLTGAGRWIWIPSVVAVAFYLLAARPVRVRYEQDLRSAVLKHAILAELYDASYDPMGETPCSYLEDAGFINSIDPRSYLSREHISGTREGLHCELADVTFPFREGHYNKMFSGCLIHITDPDASWTQLDIRAGEITETTVPLSAREQELVEKLGSFIPGSLYLHRKGQTLDVLLRARFVGFPVNPLSEISERTMQSDPLPEFRNALELAEIR